MKNAGDIQLTVGEVGGMTKAGFLQWIDLAGVSTGILKQPSNVEIYIYSPDSACYLGRYGTGTEKSAGSVVEEKFRNVYVGMLLLIAVCAWLLPFFKKLRTGSGVFDSVSGRSGRKHMLSVCVVWRDCRSD